MRTPKLLCRAGLGTLAVILTLVVSAAPAAARSTADAVASFPVQFHVINRNTSLVSCHADGKPYTIVGHITGPARALAAGTISAGALYLHGDGVDESFWRFSAVPGYNYAATLAQAGFVSVTIERLGYGQSGKPNGNDVCWGSEADVTHQIIQQLRAGTYTAMTNAGAARTAPAFARVALVGHSAAGYIVMDEAYSFHDIDALAVVASGEYPTVHTVAVLGSLEVRCPGTSDGYLLFEPTDADATTDFFYNADPRVIAAAVPNRPPDACGGFAGATASLLGDFMHNKSVTVPVLCIAGAEDAFFPNPGQQCKLFTASKSAQAVVLPNTGHGITLGRTAPKFDAAMENWLGANGFRATLTAAKHPKRRRHASRHRRSHR